MADGDERFPSISVVSALDWPSSEDELETVEIERAGQLFLNFESRLCERREFDHFSSFQDGVNASLGGDTNSGELLAGTGKKRKERNLLELTSKKLSKLTYYEILGNIPMYSTPEQIKRAYHKSCLKYHPDKTGRGEEDEVFLLVKTAFDTLSDLTKRRSYDSTVDFDESIPRGGESEDIFYKTYGPVFERNLRFDARTDPLKMAAAASGGDENKQSQGSGGKKKKNKKKKNRENGNSHDPNSAISCPDFGDENTPLDQVRAFYDYWVTFDSWRDFTLKASEMTEHDVEAADCREEKRWMAKEIDKKAKAMKREEMARIARLVERAMANDPRLRREREREKRDRERREREKRERAEAEARKKAEEEKRIEAERIEREAKQKEEKANAKVAKEKEKKMLRKAKQLLRKLTMAAFQSQGDDSAVWTDMETMNDDVELLCSKLDVEQITALTDALGGPEAAADGGSVIIDALSEVKQCASETKAGDARKTLESIRARNAARAEDAKKAAQAKAARATRPWSREELSALAKAVKKYPPGGANRWDAVAQFVTNLCMEEGSRTKEECIEKYNQIASGASPQTAAAGGEENVDQKMPSSNGTTVDASDEPDVWTEEQDKQLQDGLAKYPSSMNKNERWSAIAKGVQGRSKRECVERFKAIRDAIKKK